MINIPIKGLKRIGQQDTVGGLSIPISGLKRVNPFQNVSLKTNTSFQPMSIARTIQPQPLPMSINPEYATPNPFPQTTQAFKAAAQSVYNVGQNPLSVLPKASDEWEALKSGVQSMAAILPDSAKRIVDFISTFKVSTTNAEKVGKGLEMAMVAPNIFFSPIIGLFAAAEKMPALKPMADIINVPLTAAGETVSKTLLAALDTLPFDQPTKQSLTKGVSEWGSLIGMILAGKGAYEVGKAMHPLKTEVIKEAPAIAKAVEKIPDKAVEDLLKTHPTEEAKVIIKQAAKAAEKVKPTSANLKIAANEPLEPLAQEARKYKSAEEFEKAFLGEIKHGEYWHITDNPKFEVKQELGPRDMSSLAMGKMDKGRLMVTSDIGYWNAEYPNRKFAAKLDFSNVKPEDYYQVNRGFGNEFYVKDPSQVKVIKVVPIEQALKESEQYYNLLRKNITSKSQLTDIWNKANQAVKEPPQTLPAQPKIEPLKAELPKGMQKPSGIAKSIEAKAVEKGLTEGFKELAGYDPITIKEQAKLASDLVNTNIEVARKMVKGEIPLPEKLKGTALITAMEEYIKTTKDADAAYELANSPLVSGTSLAAQEMRLAAERVPDNATAKLREVKKARESEVKNLPKKKQASIKKLKEEMDKINLPKEELSWNRFLSKITC